MQQLADRVIACRQPGQSMEIDLACNGVQITGWLPQVQPDGLLRWRPSLLSVAGECNFGWNTLSTVPAVVMVKVAFSTQRRRVAFSAACSRTGFALPLTTD